MSFNEFDDWDPMREEYLKSLKQGSYKAKNMNNRFSKPDVNPDMVDSSSLYVRYIPRDITDGAFRNHFASYGDILRIYIHRETTAPHTYGFVNFASSESAQQALTYLNGAPPFSFQLSFARKRDNKEPKNKKPQDEEIQDLKVTASSKGRDVMLNSSSSYGSKVQQSSALKSNNEDEASHSNLQNSIQTSASPNFHNDANSADVISPPSRPPSQSSRHSSSSSSAVSTNKRISAESANADSSSVPFLSTYHALCFACDGKAYLCCSACNMPYCSPECQRTDWLYHKYKCAILAPFLSRKKYQEDMNTPKESIETTSPYAGTTENVDGMNGFIKTDKSAYCVDQAKKTRQGCSGPDSSKLTDKAPRGADCSEKTKETADNVKKIGGMRSITEEGVTPSGNTTKRHSEISSFKKQDEGNGVDVNSKKSSAPGSYPGNKINQAGMFRGKERNRKRNEDSAHKGKKSLNADVRHNAPPKKHLPYGKPSGQQNGPTSNHAVESQEPSKLKANSLTSVDLSVSRNEEVDLCFVISPEKFWVQKASNRQTLQEITNELALLSESKNLLQSPAVGGICAAYYSQDNILYRGRITEVRSGQYGVYYFDYGNTETVQANNLYTLNEKLLSCPAQALCCKLGCVKPPNSNPNWSSEDISAFNEFLKKSSEWEARVIKSDGDMYEIDLLGSGISLAALLVENGNAEFIEEELSPPSRASPRNTVASNNINEKFLKIPTVFNKLKGGSTLTLVQVHTVEDGFYAQVMADEDDVLQFAHMQDSLSTEATNLKDISASVQKDTFALAFSPNYSTWNRCYVISKNNQKSIVRFVDYGNEEEVSELRELDVHHLKVCSPLLYCGVSHSLPEEKELLRQWFNEGGQCGTVRKKKDGWVFHILKNQTACLVKLLPWWHGLSSNSLPDVQRTANFKTGELVLSTTGRNVVEIVWVNIDRNELYVQKKSVQHKIDTFQKELNDYCKSDSHVMSPSVGDMVCSPFGDKWYRGCVKEILPQGQCSVFFVDYGNEGIVKFADIRKLPAEFSTPSSFCTCVFPCDLQSLPSKIDEIVFEGTWELEVVNPSAKPVAVKIFRGGKDLLDILISEKLIAPRSECNSVSKPCSNDSSRVKSPCKKKKFLLKDIKELESSLVKVVFVDSNKCLFLHLVSESQELMKMQQRLNIFMQKSKRTPRYSPSVNDVVCAIFSEDELWYRGIVLEVTDSIQCQVLFVDYGNTAAVSCEKVMLLPVEFALIPVFSFKVSLHGVPVEVMDHRVRNQLEDTYKADIVDKSSEPVKVELFSKGRSVNQLLLNYLLPKCTSKSPETKLQKVEKVSKIPGLKTLSLPVHEKTEVVFCYGENMDSLFVHRASDRRAVADLLEALQVHCCNKDLPEYQPSAGEVVAAKSDDGMWYRGSVVHSSADACDIKFIDYGNVETIPKNLIRFLPPKFRSQPVFSIYVKLAKAESLQNSLDFQNPVCVKVLDCINGQYILELENVSCDLDVNCNSAEASVSDSEVMEIPAVEVTIGNNQDIYIYRIYNHEMIFFAPYDEKRMKEFQDFLAGINMYCKQLKDCHIPIDGELVLAKHPDKGTWQRANIFEIHDEIYQVLFIDCGDVCEITKESIRRINEKFLKFPQQSVVSKLGGCIITDENKEKIDDELYSTVSTPCRIKDAAITKIGEEFIIYLPSFQKHLITKGIIL